MTHYTDTIPLPLAEKLKEKGMLITYHPLFTPECEGADQSVGLICPNYAEVLDWLMERGINISIRKTKNDFIEEVHSVSKDFYSRKPTWHEAAEAAIEKALTLI